MSWRGRKVRYVSKATYDFHAGRLRRHRFYLKDGIVKLSLTNETGKEAVIALLSADDFLGEGCISSGAPVRMATATTMAPTTTLEITKGEMIRVLHEQKEFADRFISYMLKRNVRIEADLVDQLFNSIEKRLARALLLLARNSRRNALLKEGSKGDRIDARKLAELLRKWILSAVYHGESGLRMLKE